MQPKPKIKLLDIETGYNLVKVHSLYQFKGGGIPAHAIGQERYIICASFKDLGTGAIRSYHIAEDSDAFELDPTHDLGVVRSILAELDDADAVIGHNSDRFDLRRINARAVWWMLPPVKPLVQIDTLKIAKKHFDFNSNRLDYLAKYLGLPGKARAGEVLWTGALHGDAKCVLKLVKYNRQDVRVLEGVFKRLAPWGTAKLNRALYHGERQSVCPHCGSTHVQSRGTYHTKSRTYRQWQCQAARCRAWFRATLSDSSTVVTSV